MKPEQEQAFADFVATRSAAVRRLAQQTAQALRCSTGTVKSQTSRALDAIRAMPPVVLSALGPDGDEDRRTR